MARGTLAIFMAVGAVSGLIAGILLLDDVNKVTYVEGPSITVYTDYSDYKKGEPVTAVLVNSGSVPLASDDSWEFRVTGLSGMLMYVASDATPGFLEPGMQVVTVWNQTKNNGDAVLEGLYRITVEGYDPDGEPVKDWTTFSIWK